MSMEKDRTNEYRPKFKEVVKAEEFRLKMEDIEIRKAMGILEPLESFLIRKGKI